MFRSGNLRVAFLFAVCLPTFAALAADSANVDTARSSVVATFKQSGVPIDSPFNKFSGRIVYDPANVTGASAAIEVDTGSLDIGEEDYNAEVRKAQWFDVATYPKATFKSTAIRSTGANTFVATGTLTVKGRAQTLSVPIAARKTANGIAFEGAFTLSRKAFALGDPLWEDVLEDKVGVRFTLISSGGPAK
jgi:polyisoprenoid-binding protein YceI